MTLLLATGGPVESVHRPGFPVVFTSGGDPCTSGASMAFNRPGVNVTGICSGVSGASGVSPRQLCRKQVTRSRSSETDQFDAACAENW